MLSESLNTTGKRITLLRQLRNKMLQKELAQLLLSYGVDVNPSFLSQIESDKKSPSISMLRALALALETTTDFLLCLSDNPERVEEHADQDRGYITPEAEAAASIIDGMRNREAREHVLRVAEFMASFEDTLGIQRETEIRQRNQQEWASMLAELERLEGKATRDRVEKGLLALAPTSGGGHAPMLGSNEAALRSRSVIR